MTDQTLRVHYTIKLNKHLGAEPQYYWISEKQEVMVFRVHGQVRVFSSICPHMGARLCLKQGGKVLRCPWHQFRFDLKSKCSNHKNFKNVREFRAEVVGGELRIYT